MSFERVELGRIGSMSLDAKVWFDRVEIVMVSANSIAHRELSISMAGDDLTRFIVGATRVLAILKRGRSK